MYTESREYTRQFFTRNITEILAAEQFASWAFTLDEIDYVVARLTESSRSAIGDSLGEFWRIINGQEMEIGWSLEEFVLDPIAVQSMADQLLTLGGLVYKANLRLNNHPAGNKLAQLDAAGTELYRILAELGLAGVPKSVLRALSRHFPVWTDALSMIPEQERLETMVIASSRIILCS